MSYINNNKQTKMTLLQSIACLQKRTRSNDYLKSKLPDQIRFFKTCRLGVTIIWPIWKILHLLLA